MKNKWIGVVIGLWVFMFLLPGAFAKESCHGLHFFGDR